MPGARSRYVLLVPAFLLSLVVLGPVLDGPFFCDDFHFALDDPPRHVLGSFGELHPYRLYRPLQLSIVALSQTIFGSTTLPVHVATLGVHLALVALVLRMAGSLGWSPIATTATVLWLSASQLLPPAVGGNDTISLVLGTALGSLAAWWLWPVPARGECPRRIPYALLAFALALLSKESSLGALPVLLTLLAVPPREPARGTVPAAIALVGIAAGYLALRASLGADGPRFGPGGDWMAGVNVPVNAIQLIVAALLPMSTVDVFSAVVRQEWSTVLLAAAALLAVAVLLLAGPGARRVPVLLGALAVSLAAVAPVLPMKHVSELYAYGLLPPVALALGAAVGGLWSRSGRLRRIGLAGALAGLLLLQADAAWRKSRDMAENGRRAGPLMARLIRAAMEQPHGGTLVLVEPVHARPQYSVFQMDGFRLTPPEEIVRLSGRSDLRVIHLPADAPLRAQPASTDALWLTLEGDVPVPLVPAEGLPLFSRPRPISAAPAAAR